VQAVDPLQKSLLTVLFYTLGAIAVLFAGFLVFNRPVVVTIDAAIPEDFPEDGFSHAVFERLLARYVDSDGNVAYERWHAQPADRQALDAYLAAAATYSPDNHPTRFPASSDALAYWLYAYNACVIRGVLMHWPVSSVTDVKAPIEAVKGLGFFYRQRFVFGGEPLSLYNVEHEKILATYRDPRVHFVLNCASESCPVLRPELPTGDELELLLQSATRDFINDPRNVRVDTDGRRIVLSTIFRWYRRDFENDLQRRGLPAGRGVIDYIVEFADEALANRIAGTEDYSVEYVDYDWALNQQ
jgi:hypothetical protein